ncbi:S-layer protein [Methanosarcina sp. A14]|uniref:S-layer family duplication domain protein n=3 Tax=Methanosarcina barkeri TaxID=2208 RepID=A0A0E3QXK7_METBA|nr:MULTISPECIES: S-layer protein domain-containing protein [Methanosarcina]AKB55485.1 S-layer family duplication domain protein [Methanosarcina barkeri MS]AKJ38650.1 S-layer duplication domain-containing protein [Methanosarcina barkeri CM1]OEC89611.1 S-layer protein [Methanosarcina sp. A14]
MGIKNYIKILCLFLAFGFLCLSAVAQASDSTGNRIWDENANENLTYTWTPQTYSGFYYDLDTGEGSENLTVQLSKGSRTINKRNLQYETVPIKTDFEYGNWGSYDVIGFMAERYFAGYTANSSFADKEISVISDGQLSKVLIDSDDRKSLYTGSSLVLDEGYSLNMVEVDINGNSVWVQLEKDGKIVDEAFLSSNSDYVYKADLGDTENVPIIAVHFSQIFSGRETNAVFVNGIFQISDQYVKVQNGDDFGEMEVSSTSSSGIKMRNSDSISLSKGDTIDIMGKLSFVVADANELRFAPIVETSEPGTYELRGTVHDDKFDTMVWTPFNFEGFYYNIDENISTESLTIEKLDGRTIDDEALVYSTKPENVKFEHEGWGSYKVIGFMAEKYFAGYPENTLGNSKGISVLSDRVLSKVLIDDDDKKSLFTGSSLALENGYSLKASQVDVNGKSVLFELYKNGKLLDSGIVSQGGDYIYETDIGGAENVPMIAVHISTVFRSTETDAVFVEGIFQISDDYLEISGGDSFGEMKITSISDSGITMKNEDSISLSKDDVVDLMGNVKFKVADSSVLRFYPFVETETEEGDQLDIEIPDALVVGKPTEILVTARNISVVGAEIFVGNKSIGTTGDSGNLTFTPSNEGSFTVTASREGYVSGTKDVDVLAQGILKLLVSVSPENVREGDQISIKVTDSEENKPVSGADVFFGGQIIDAQTDAKGITSYMVTTPGTYVVNATKTGYEDGETQVEVAEKAAQFTFSDLTIQPASVEAGTAVNIKVNAMNNGGVTGNSTVELLVNNESVDSQNITLNPGENKSIEFSHTEGEQGTYTVEVGGLSESYEVTKKAPFFSGMATLGILATAFVILRKRRN